jgi:hypothetical protein
MLVDQLGIEPGQALQRLERAILEHDASLELPPTEPPLADRLRPREPVGATAKTPSTRVASRAASWRRAPEPWCSAFSYRGRMPPSTPLP